MPYQQPRLIDLALAIAAVVPVIAAVVLGPVCLMMGVMTLAYSGSYKPIYRDIMVVLAACWIIVPMIMFVCGIKAFKSASPVFSRARAALLLTAWLVLPAFCYLFRIVDGLASTALLRS